MLGSRIFLLKIIYAVSCKHLGPDGTRFCTYKQPVALIYMTPDFQALMIKRPFKLVVDQGRYFFSSWNSICKSESSAWSEAVFMASLILRSLRATCFDFSERTVDIT